MYLKLEYQVEISNPDPERKRRHSLALATRASTQTAGASKFYFLDTTDVKNIEGKKTLKRRGIYSASFIGG